MKKWELQQDGAEAEAEADGTINLDEHSSCL